MVDARASRTGRPDRTSVEFVTAVDLQYLHYKAVRELNRRWNSLS
jgi:hypothetical protein